TSRLLSACARSEQPDRVQLLGEVLTQLLHELFDERLLIRLQRCVRQSGHEANLGGRIQTIKPTCGYPLRPGASPRQHFPAWWRSSLSPTPTSGASSSRPTGASGTSGSACHPISPSSRTTTTAPPAGWCAACTFR